MIFGNIQGLVNGTEQVVFDYEVAGSAVSSISTGDILNGDEDGWYTVIARNIYDTGTATMTAYFNADSTAGNYGYRGITANNTTVADTNSTGALIRMGAVASGSTSAFSVLRFYAKQGAVRLLNGMNVCNINGTTVTQLETIGSVWNNTNTNITSMTFAAEKLGVGTRIIILKSNNFTGGTPTGVITTPYIQGSWVRVGSQVLGSAVDTITFSGLDGDRDVIYYAKAVIKQKTSDAYLGVHINNTAGTGYGHQMLAANNTTASAGRYAAGNSVLYFGENENSTAGTYHGGDLLLFAKTGFLRPSISQGFRTTSGTTVTEIKTLGQSWNDTSTNITSLVVFVHAGTMDVGSQIELYALRPNG